MGSSSKLECDLKATQGWSSASNTTTPNLSTLLLRIPREKQKNPKRNPFETLCEIPLKAKNGCQKKKTPPKITLKTEEWERTSDDPIHAKFSRSTSEPPWRPPSLHLPSEGWPQISHQEICTPLGRPTKNGFKKFQTTPTLGTSMADSAPDDSSGAWRPSPHPPFRQRETTRPG